MTIDLRAMGENIASYKNTFTIRLNLCKWRIDDNA